MRSLDSIQKTVLHLLAYTRGGKSHSAEDLMSWRSPSRFEFLVSDLVTSAGGRSELPEKQVEIAVQKLGYTWDEGIKRALATGLKPYGITMSTEDYEAPDYSTPTRETLLKGSKIRKLKGKSW